MPSIVALAEVDIANMALSYLGISTQLQALTDNNEQGKACAFWYPKCRDQLLRWAPWDFAFTSQLLAVDPSRAGPAGSLGAQVAFPGYAYAYQYPNDCLQAIAVTTVAGQRTGALVWNHYWGSYPGYNITIPKIPYKITQSVANPGQLMICCDLSPTQPAYLFYIQGVTNTAQFDPLFSDALAYQLAVRVGSAIRSANPQKVQYCQAMATQRSREALAQVLNAAQQDYERQSPSVQARW